MDVVGEEGQSGEGAKGKPEDIVNEKSLLWKSIGGDVEECDDDDADNDGNDDEMSQQQSWEGKEEELRKDPLSTTLESLSRLT